MILKKNKFFFIFLLLTVTKIYGEQSYCSVDDDARIDCFPENWSNQTGCEARNCCWKEAKKNSELDTPWCFYPSNFKGFEILNVTKNDESVIIKLKKLRKPSFPKEFSEVFIKINYINDYRLQVKIEDASKQRFEAPVNLELNKLKTTAESRLYITYYDDQFLYINRKSTNKTIWKMNYQVMILSDQWLEVATYLPSSIVFGLGEHKDTYRKYFDKERKKLLFFSSDQPPTKNSPLYGIHPVYLSYENKENKVDAHSFALLNSNAIEAILSPNNVIVWRTIGGIFNFFFNLGPKPETAVSQYVSLVGKPSLPPYWALGFHLSKYGYNSLEKMKETFKRMQENKIPLDVHWNDIDFMKDYNIFTYDNNTFKDLPNYVNFLHQNNVKYIPMFDPGMGGGFSKEEYPQFYEGLEKDIFLKNYDGKILKAKVWNKYFTAWVDFTKHEAWEFWINQFERFHEKIEFDGAWIDMNEPSSQVIGSLTGCDWSSSLENPYFVPVGLHPLAKNTACMTSKHFLGTHYDLHNMYSYFEAKATMMALINLKKRPFIISRSTFMGHGRYASHWTGDVSSTWEDLKYSISNILSFNIFGIPVVGADICGFLGNTDDELCARWQSLGAFYTFSRNHNDIASKEQDPAILGQVVKEATIYSLKIKYSLLPFLYTEIFKSTKYGKPVLKALSLVFPSDINTYGIEDQFLWGDSILIIPIIEKGKNERKAYFPKSIWYDYDGYKIISKSSDGEFKDLNIPLNRIVVAIKGGSIILKQFPQLTTYETRKNNFELLCFLNENKEASGEIYWDDGETYGVENTFEFSFIQFNSEKNMLSNEIKYHGYDSIPKINIIKVLGIDFEVKEVKVNAEDTNFEYNIEKLELTIVVDLEAFNKFNITWA